MPHKRFVTVLGIETSSKVCSVALIDGNRIKDEISLNVGLVHSEKLITLVDMLLKKNMISAGSLGGIVVSTGPGSFTGIRVGVSAARGLAQSLGIPLAGVSSLDGLANNVIGIKKIEDGSIVCPVIDALREEVYTAVYRKASAGIKRLTDYSLVKIKSLLSDLKKKGKEVFFLGDAVDLYGGSIRMNLDRGIIADKEVRYPSALSIALAGMKRISRKRKEDYRKVLPLYIRKPEAEIKWRERKK